MEKGHLHRTVCIGDKLHVGHGVTIIFDKKRTSTSWRILIVADKELMVSHEKGGDLDRLDATYKEPDRT